MRCLIRYMRKECEKRGLRLTEIIVEGDDLGAMVDAVVPKLSYTREFMPSRNLSKIGTQI